MGVAVTWEATLAYVITKPCLSYKDASCVEVCPCDCIHSYGGQAMYFIDPDECIDCGACVSVCPVEAIRTCRQSGSATSG